MGTREVTDKVTLVAGFVKLIVVFVGLKGNRDRLFKLRTADRASLAIRQSRLCAGGVISVHYVRSMLLGRCCKLLYEDFSAIRAFLALREAACGASGFNRRKNLGPSMLTVYNSDGSASVALCVVIVVVSMILQREQGLCNDYGIAYRAMLSFGFAVYFTS